ncbi:MAG: hypothetical protein AAF750_02930 [Planctomycetota bacterium]
MLINAYYYAPHNHSLLTRHLRADLKLMASLGTDLVSVCVAESQLTNWHQQRLRNTVDLIHEYGMRACAIPNRWAGLTAGWFDGFSHFTLMNPDALIEEAPGRPRLKGEMPCCVNKTKVRDHIRHTLDVMLDGFEFDALIWDEPHAHPCACDACQRDHGTPDADRYNASFVRFIDDMNRHARAVRPDLMTGVFVEPHDRGLLEALLRSKTLDYAGSDGHIRRPSYRMHRMKRTIFEAYDEFAPLIHAAGLGSVFLPEGQRHRDEDLQEYIKHVDAAFALPMDQLLFYFSAHEMTPASEQPFNEATWSAVQRVAHRRQTTPTSALKRQTHQARS